MCKSWCELIIAVVVIVSALWPYMYSNWVIVIAGVILLIHSFTCKKCFSGHGMRMDTMPARRRKRK